MMQALRIFAKDVRLYWVEIVATLTITALFVWVYPMDWGVFVQPRSIWPWVPGTITALVPVSWLVLITRVVHAESLVGERQFWITRPYLWPQLIISKALFVAIFIYLPFFIAQCLLLRQAGMHPSLYLQGLFFNLILTTGIAVLPMACIATVTGNFARMLLGMLCVLLFVAGVAYFDTLLPSSSTTNSFGDVLGFVAPVSFFIAVLVIQYARRWTLLSRSLLVALALTISVLALFGPEDTAMRITYPVSSISTGLQIGFRQAPPIESIPDSDSVDERELTLIFPVAMSGIAAGTAMKVDNARVSISSLDGERWTSHWQGVFLTWMPGAKDSEVSLKVNRAFYNRTKDKPVTVHLSLALTMLRAGNVTRIVLPEGRFSLPGGSVCKNASGWVEEISCLSPMRQPPLTLVTTQFSTQECSSAPPANDGDRGLGWIGTLDSQPAEFGITSVWVTSVYLQPISSKQSAGRQHLCTGSPLLSTPYSVVSRNQQTVVSQPMNLSKLIPSRS